MFPWALQQLASKPSTVGFRNDFSDGGDDGDFGFGSDANGQMDN